METNEATQQLQHIEHNLEHLQGQKKNFQLQLSEIEAALEELQDKDSSYKIIGNIMLKRDAETTRTELNEKQETLKVRISSIEKQEAKFKDKVKELQETVIKNTKK